MDVILGVDAITPPLTGIGRYAFELATRLPRQPVIESVRYFSFGRWKDGIDFDSVNSATELSREATIQPKLNIRRVLAGSSLVLKAYSLLTPSVYRWRLRGERNSLFHSPNYFLPPFPGKSVATIHDLSHFLFPQFHPAARIEYMERALPETLRRADFLITDAESVRAEVIQHFGWSPDRIAAVPLGVDTNFHPRTAEDLMPVLQRYGLHLTDYTLCVGTIEPRKNLDRLLTAYEALPATLRQRCPLVLVGSRGWLSEVIFHRIAKGTAADWVRYLNFVEQKDLPFLYAGARLFAYPSLYEGFGLPPLEAMASGIPVVTSNVSSLPEVVGEAAILVDPKDEVALSRALRRGLEDEEWRVAAIVLGLRRASILRWEQCIDQTVSIYKKILAQR
jgi:glycosyltransferase involved in cell wall biosynthesis